MKTFKFEEIINKHGQYIVYFSGQPGNTEMEKYKNFLGKKTFKEFEGSTIDGKLIKVIVEKGAFTVFNELEEKIADYEGNNIKIDTTNELVDIIKELDDLGIGI